MTQGGDWGCLVSSRQCQDSHVDTEFSIAYTDHKRNSNHLWGKVHESLAYEHAHVRHISSVSASFSEFSSSTVISRGAPPSFSRPFLLLSHLLSYLPFLGYTDRENIGVARLQEFFKSEHGYVVLQSTKPQTLGYGLADSPVALLAWIYEKLVGWTDAYPWEDDEGAFSIFCDAQLPMSSYLDTCCDVPVLTWISIYEFSRAGPASSLRIYYEISEDLWLTSPSANIPVGYSYFPKEIGVFPRR